MIAPECDAAKKQKKNSLAVKVTGISGHLFNLVMHSCPAIADTKGIFLDSHSFAYWNTIGKGQRVCKICCPTPVDRGVEGVCPRINSNSEFGLININAVQSAHWALVGKGLWCPVLSAPQSPVHDSRFSMLGRIDCQNPAGINIHFHGYNNRGRGHRRRLP